MVSIPGGRRRSRAYVRNDSLQYRGDRTPWPCLFNAYEVHIKLCFGGVEQREAENRGGLCGTTVNQCTERMWQSCVTLPTYQA
ncbi:hypothetical protein EVAR_83563_1 [Eumeta japonica]|uniref:Uncharacterized protein n=1 Tax=Eumeta variegata TaxID=151549 RepID=A0A4C1UQ17_EUMVA|nr:hypothetical protein EVAR_83563_1 [Eumeta japonica]